MNRLFLFLTALLFWTYTTSAQVVIRGKVLDASNGMPLAFVTIVTEAGGQGVSSDIDGKFAIKPASPQPPLRFSFVGYETQSVSIKGDAPLLVRMKRSTKQLAEVKIFPGLNPADRIMEKASENRNRNNPEKNISFTYTSYNKFYVTGDFKRENDTLNGLDTSARRENRIQKLFDRRHLFLTESVSKRKYRNPGQNHEEIIASRTSGLKTPLFTFLGNQMQSFSFYDKTIKILDRTYMSPLVNGTTSKYLFVIEDTLFSGKDTVFVISFRPQHGKKFDALKGLLYVNSNGYAVQNVIAEPFEAEGLFTIKIQQKYECLDGDKWFPSQLNTDLYYNDFSLSDTTLTISIGGGKKAGVQNNDGKLKVVSRSYIRDVVIDPLLRKREFGSLEVEVAPDAPDKDEAFWSNYRVDSLTRRDQKTYQVLDSLGKASNLDFKIKALSAFIDGQIPWKFICFDLNRFLDENKYENIRMGIGIHTSRRVSEYFTVGGYGAYGIQDKQFKYGLDASVFPYKKNKDYALSYAWSNDLVETGGISFFQDKQFLGSEAFRGYLIGVFDKQTIHKGSVRFRVFDYFLCNLYLSEEKRSSTNAYRYGYPFSGGQGSATFNSFDFTETGFQLKYVYREKFTEFLDRRISQGSDYPIVYLNLIKGFNALPGFSGQYDYMKYEFKVSKQFITAKAGKPYFQILGGLVSGNLPYTKLFAGHGSFVNYTLDVPNTFETMALNEFLSDRYIAFFYSHDFGRLFIRKKYFQPQVIFVNRVGFGSLSNPGNHFNVDYKTMERGYYETGLLLNNLIRRGYLGLGGGIYYRYGPYAFADETRNYAVKFSLTFNF